MPEIFYPCGGHINGAVENVGACIRCFRFKIPYTETGCRFQVGVQIGYEGTLSRRKAGGCQNTNGRIYMQIVLFRFHCKVMEALYDFMASMSDIDGIGDLLSPPDEQPIDRQS